MRADTILDLITVQDVWLMRRVQRWRAPRWVRLWMIVATRAGDGWLWYAQAPVILLFGGHPRFLCEAAAGIGAAASIGTFQTLKRKIGRKRPCMLGLHSWATLLPPRSVFFPFRSYDDGLRHFHPAHSFLPRASSHPALLFFEHRCLPPNSWDALSERRAGRRRDRAPTWVFRRPPERCSSIGGASAARRSMPGSLGCAGPLSAVAG